MDKPATIHDIARNLNISISTVSRALRNASDVNSETKKAVIALAEELNYQPNRLAISLRQKQTHTIGVIVPNLDYVVSQMVKGIDEVALEAGYTIMVCQSNESFGREILNTRRLVESLVDGFIISVSSETKSFEHVKKLFERNIPIVLFDRIAADLTVPSVSLDNNEGGFMATEHLIEQGFKRIALLTGPKNLGISNSRMDGYLRALKKYKIKKDENIIIHCDFNQDYAFFATKELLAMKKRPDAILAISDRMAIGAMLAIKEKGLQIPQDIAIISFNNEPVVSLVSPSISSIDINAFEMGKAAAKLFIETVHAVENITKIEVVLQPTLIIRDSSQKRIQK